MSTKPATTTTTTTTTKVTKNKRKSTTLRRILNAKFPKEITSLAYDSNELFAMLLEKYGSYSSRNEENDNKERQIDDEQHRSTTNSLGSIRCDNSMCIARPSSPLLLEIDEDTDITYIVID
ncbi:unnamed protein product [Adineta steineri]|uniref:Uncharacterized protein n=1 Tax=Adineta steineri TaxID=433720 RepID=A0A816GWX3_9BILA|nr:unnamed protein product [Adineta steineri]CAF1680397.1 unnamed protein product [Adineta steineri]